MRHRNHNQRDRYQGGRSGGQGNSPQAERRWAGDQYGQYDDDDYGDESNGGYGGGYGQPRGSQGGSARGGGDWRGGGRGSSQEFRGQGQYGDGAPDGSWQHGEYGGEAYGAGPEQYGRSEGFSGRSYGGGQNYRGGMGQGQDYRGGQSYAVGQSYGGGQSYRGGQSRFGEGQSYGRGQSQYAGGQYGRPSYAGKGPKGYTRSDDRIREDVSDALMADPDIDASEIELDVKNGEVTLRGSVDSREARRATEDLVESVHGVRNVQNSIRIGSGSVSSSGDSDSSRTSKNR